MPRAATKIKNPDLASELKGRLKAYYGRDEGDYIAVNPAIPNDPLYIYDWEEDYQYYWVPAPGGLAPAMHTAPEMHQRRSNYLWGGWQYYPPEYLAHTGGLGFPWLSEWEDDNGKVRSMDHWLMYADKDIENRRREERLEKWNDARRVRKEEAPEEIEIKTEGGGIKRLKGTVEFKSGQTTVGKLLNEGD